MRLERFPHQIIGRHYEYPLAVLIGNANYVEGTSRQRPADDDSRVSLSRQILQRSPEDLHYFLLADALIGAMRKSRLAVSMVTNLHAVCSRANQRSHTQDNRRL